MKVEKPYHIHDTTHKYCAMAFTKRLHQYLKLPGEYVRRYPTEVVLRNLETGRMDELYEISGNRLVNLEDESEDISEKTLKKFSKYKTFGTFIYAMEMITAVICRKDPKNFPNEYNISETDILRPIYIHFSQDELWEKYENIINKIEQKQKLTDDEALDIAFIPKYISKENGAYITESLAKVFKNAKIPDNELKRDIAVILAAMILKHVDETKQKKLMEEIDMEKYETEIDEMFMKSSYGEKLNQLEKENKKTNKNLQKTNETLQKTNQNIEKTRNILDKLSENGEISTKTKNIILQTLITIK